MSRLRILRKLPLTTKQVNKGYYKGTGSGSMGWHTKHGGYRIDWKKVRTYIVPTALEGFKVCCYTHTRARARTPVGRWKRSARSLPGTAAIAWFSIKVN